MIDLSSHILFADADVVVLDKPAGMVVNQADSNRSTSIQEWFTEYLAGQPEVPVSEWRSQVPADFNAQYGTPTNIWAERRGLVHRLDKDTSGVLLLAKHPGALVNLLSQFRLRQVQKTYVCLIHGGLSIPQGIINAPIKRAQGDRKKFAVTIDGREAVTTYKVIERYQALRCLANHSSVVQPLAADQVQPPPLPAAALKILRQNWVTYTQGFSLVECEPKTGRTHQIRVHLAHLQHPVVGDQVYVGKKRTNLDRLWCPRQFLHARHLTFTHPRTNQSLSVESPLPADLTSALQQLA